MISKKKEDSPPADEIEVTVGEIKGEGDQQYVVFYTIGDGALPKGTPITFSMKYWKGKREPQKGQVAVVREVQKFAKGWRAFEAVSVFPGTSNKQQAGGEV